MGCKDFLHKLSDHHFWHCSTKSLSVFGFQARNMTTQSFPSSHRLMRSIQENNPADLFLASDSQMIYVWNNHECRRFFKYWKLHASEDQKVPKASSWFDFYRLQLQRNSRYSPRKSNMQVVNKPPLQVKIIYNYHTAICWCNHPTCWEVWSSRLWSLQGLRIKCLWST